MNVKIDIRPYRGEIEAPIEVGGLQRKGPVCQVEDGLWIVGNDNLSYGCDIEFTQKVAAILAQKLKPFNLDCLLTAASKSIGFVYEIARQLGHKEYALARKNISPLPEDFLEAPIRSITSGENEHLIIDGKNIAKVTGKKIALFDETISTGGTMEGLKELAEKAGAKMKVIATIWLEGTAPFKVFAEEFKQGKFIYLATFPLFATGETYKQLLIDKKRVEEQLQLT